MPALRWHVQALSLRDLDAHYDPGVAALAKQAASTLPPQRVAEPVEALLNSLVNERDSIPDKDPRLTHLDNTIVPLTQLVSDRRRRRANVCTGGGGLHRPGLGN